MTLRLREASNGLSFTVSEIPDPLPITVTTSETMKLETLANFSFDVHHNSYKYDNEVVISGWSRRFPTLKPRSANSAFFRVEIPIPLNDYYHSQLELLPVLEDKLSMIPTHVNITHGQWNNEPRPVTNLHELL